MKYLITFLFLILTISTTFSQETIIIGPGRPPEGYKFKWERNDRDILRKARERAIKRGGSRDDVKILEVPAFNWTYGCSPTAAGMLIGYYDRNGYPDLVTEDDIPGGICPLTNEYWNNLSNSNPKKGDGDDGECSFIASEDHKKDFWTEVYNETDSFHDGGWTPHCNPGEGNCLADFMGTSQWWVLGYRTYNSNMEQDLHHPDGASLIHFNNLTPETPFSPDKFGGYLYGVCLYINSKKYFIKNYCIIATNSSGTYTNGFTFDDFCNEIDNGRPMIINLVGPSFGYGHTVLGVGYNKSTDHIYIHDTWDYSTHEMNWYGSYENYTIVSVNIIELSESQKVGDLEVTIVPEDNKKGSTYPDGEFLTVTGIQKITAVPEKNYVFNHWDSDSDNIVIKDPNSTETEADITGAGKVTAYFKLQSTDTAVRKFVFNNKKLIKFQIILDTDLSFEHRTLGVTVGNNEFSVQAQNRKYYSDGDNGQDISAESKKISNSGYLFTFTAKGDNFLTLDSPQFTVTNEYTENMYANSFENGRYTEKISWKYSKDGLQEGDFIISGLKFPSIRKKDNSYKYSVKIKGENLSLDNSDSITVSIGGIEFNFTLIKSKDGKKVYKTGKNKLTVKNGRFSLSIKGSDDILHGLPKESSLIIQIGYQSCAVEVVVKQVIKY